MVDGRNDPFYDVFKLHHHSLSRYVTSKKDKKVLRYGQEKKFIKWNKSFVLTFHKISASVGIKKSSKNMKKNCQSL